MRRRAYSLLLGCLAAAAWVMVASLARAADKVDLLLVLAADISRSVNDSKFKLQREGYAAALTTPRVVRAITSGEHGRIAICFVEWSGTLNQTVLIDWTMVAGAEDARRVAAGILSAQRLFRDRTAIGNALEFSARQFELAPYEAPRRVIDVSGDGTSNAGRDVVEVRNELLARGITVNGLVILSNTPLRTNPNHTHPPGGLLAYFENNVVGGPGAFAMAAEGFETFGASLTAKLIKEISALPRQQRGWAIAAPHRNIGLAGPTDGLVPVRDIRFHLQRAPRVLGSHPISGSSHLHRWASRNR